MNRLVEISLYSTVLVGVILLFRRLLHKRLSPAVQYGIWFLLILRLIVPFALESPIHFIKMPMREEASISTPTASGYAEQYIQPDALETKAEAIKPSGNSPLTEPYGDNPSVPFIRQNTIMLIWIAGMVAQSAYYALGFLRIQRFKLSSRLITKEAYAMLEACKNELGLSVPVRLCTIESSGTPALIPGKCILLPSSVMENESSMRFALLHELTHIQRHDYPVLALLHMLRCVYWFHPVVRIGLSEMRADMEMACDADVTARMDAAQKKSYYMMLIDLFSSAPATTLAMAQGARRTANRRIKGAAMPRAAHSIARLAACGLAAVSLLLCFTTACHPMPPVEQNDLEGIKADAKSDGIEQHQPPSPTDMMPARREETTAPSSADILQEADSRSDIIYEDKLYDNMTLEGIASRLTELGYPGEVDKKEYTGYAVELFQRTNGLTIDGIYGEETRAVLFSPSAKPYIMAIGMQGRDISQLQMYLKDMGLITKVTGYFGTDTQTAVSSYQRTHGLEVNGEVSIETLEHITTWLEESSDEHKSADGLIDIATSMIGTKYVHGGKTKGAVDAGGLVYYCLNELGLEIKYTTSAKWQEAEYPTISDMEDLRPGDIICFGNIASGSNGHVGIYVGDGGMIHASSAAGEVRKDENVFRSSYWTRNFVCAKRVV